MMPWAPTHSNIPSQLLSFEVSPGNNLDRPFPLSPGGPNVHGLRKQSEMWIIAFCFYLHSTQCPNFFLGIGVALENS